MCRKLFIKTQKDNRIDSIKHFFVYWFPVLIHICLIFYLSSLSALSEFPGMQQGPESFREMGMESDFWPRLAHVLEYGLLSALIFRAAINSRREWLRVKPFLWAILFSSLYGISDELHQAYVVCRSCNVYDWLSDVCGASIAQIIIFVTRRT